MTILDFAIQPQPRTVWRNADWSMYATVQEWLNGNRAFVTFYRGNLEVVAPSFRHDRAASILHQIVLVLAEETDTKVVPARSATLRRDDLDAAVEADDAFYIAHADVMTPDKRDIDLSKDPPPDLVIEVEITSRLRERLDAYRDLGIPELWRYGDQGLVILVNRSTHWEPMERSPTFGQLSRQELARFVTAGMTQDAITWIKTFRRRVREAVAKF